VSSALSSRATYYGTDETFHPITNSVLLSRGKLKPNTLRFRISSKLFSTGLDPDFSNHSLDNKTEQRLRRHFRHRCIAMLKLCIAALQIILLVGQVSDNLPML
jgi:hypothetical protein